MTNVHTIVPPGRETTPGATQVDARAINRQDNRSFYRAREPVHPKLVHGKFRSIKWAVLIVTLSIFYGLPWIRLDRGPGLPDQAYLLDFAHQRLYLFWLEIWAQEFYYVTGILVLSGLALFLVTALAGRVWCGYACPQTVWTDLMVLAERAWQGDRNARLKLVKAPWSFNKAWRLAGTQLTWALIALSTGVTAIFYFRDAPTLASELLHNDAPPLAYAFIGVFTAFTYLLGALAREQMCTYMCPWPRIQGAMIDGDSLLITYRNFRGEPRGPHKKGQSWEGRGDCIDCGQCVAVCSAGIDIRHGAQLECIQCALCIDACDEIMDKIGRPRKLIAYDSYRNLVAETHGDRVPYRLIRPRTMYYGVAFAVVALVMLFGLTRMTVLDVNVVPDRNPLFVLESGGGIQNGYIVRILNKKHSVRKFAIAVTGLKDATLSYVGVEAGEPPIEVKSDDVRAVKVYVTVAGAEAAKMPASANIGFTVRDTVDGNETTRDTNFKGPGQ
ncbi:MAG: cytochrome c oxidase accessory protein CcoG [Rhodomicrobium sp.]